MLIALVIVLWFLCGLAGIHLAFAAARSRQDNFDPVHIWLAILGPISLVLAGITFADANRGSAAAASVTGQYQLRGGAGAGGATPARPNAGDLRSERGGQALVSACRPGMATEVR